MFPFFSFFSILFRKFKTIILLILICHGTTGSMALKFGTQNAGGADYASNLLRPTLEYLSNSLQTNISFAAYDDKTLQNLLKNKSLDLAYAASSLFSCAQLDSDIVPLLTIVQEAGDIPIYEQGAVVYSLASSNISRFSDLRGKIVSSGDISQLSGFQAQFGAVLDSGVNLFTDALAVLLAPDQPSALDVVSRGIADAAFLSPTIFAQLSKSNSSLSSTFQVVGQMNNMNVYPYAISTPLYPNPVLIAQQSLNPDIRNRIIETLISLKPTDGSTASGGYYGWTSPASYTSVELLQAAIGIKDPNTLSCVNVADLYDAILCPDGFYKKPGSLASSSCASSSIICPKGFQCVCSPCMRKSRAAHVGRLSIAEFLAITLGISAFIGTLLIAAWRIHVLRRGGIKFADLNINKNTRLGKARQGLVFKGAWKGEIITVKRALPKRTKYLKKKSMFDDDLDFDTPAALLRKVKITGEMDSEVHMDCSARGCRMFFGFSTPESTCKQLIQDQSKVRHPSLLRIFGWSAGPENSELLVIRQFIPGETLFELIRNPSVDVTVPFAASLCRDVADGLVYLHALRPPGLGRNLRSHHLFVNENYRCLIGLSFNQYYESGRAMLMIAPEILRGRKPTVESDIYALGMLMYEVFHRHDIFESEDPEDVLYAIRDVGSEEPKRPVIKDTLPDTIRHLIILCWNEDMTLRPSLESIINVLGQYASTSIQQAIMLEQRQNNDLLRQILPDYAVTALREGKRPPAKHSEMVTIYFSDIKNFTKMSSVLHPFQVMQMLDLLYTQFDGLSKKHGIMKIETIGDSWMGVAGLMDDEHLEKPDHAARVARFAIEAVKAAGSIRMPGGDSNERLHIRSGFHSGPVSSGVVGTDRPRFGLFGDSVNCASRMESTGEPDRIQMSHQAATLVSQQDPNLGQRIIRRAGEIAVKGKGVMQTYWLKTDLEMVQRRRSSAEMEDSTLNLKIF